MSDYIRREDAFDAFNRAVQDVGILDADDIETVFGMLSSADVAPVVHAYWIDTDNYYRRWRCSACSGHTKEAHPPFCPFCGAKMDGEEREHESIYYSF